MKKIVSLVVMLLTVVCIMGSVYAAPNCNVGITTEKTEYRKNDEIVAQVSISNIQSEKGIIAFGATLEYDKDSLTLLKIEGQNGWSNPSINNANGKFVMDRSDRVKNNETLLKITFKVKETSKQNLSITIKDVSIGDGTAPAKINGAVRNITIKEASSPTTPTNPTNPGGDDKKPTTPTTPGTDNKNQTTSGTDNKNSTISGTNNKNQTTSTNKGTTNKNIATSKVLPKAGTSSVVSVIVIGCLVIVSVISYMKIKKINKSNDFGKKDK